jgi:hypothetical protein
MKRLCKRGQKDDKARLLKFFACLPEVSIEPTVRRRRGVRLAKLAAYTCIFIFSMRHTIFEGLTFPVVSANRDSKRKSIPHNYTDSLPLKSV